MFRHIFHGAVLTFLLSSCAFGQAPAILLNQEGFYAYGPKQVIVTGGKSDRFFIIDQPNGDTVWKGPLNAKRKSLNSSLVTQVADFRQLQTEGRYKIIVPGIDQAAEFSIGPDVHHALTVAALKGFYYQRVSIPLEKKYAGIWARPAGHPDTAVLVHPSAATTQRPAGTLIKSPGGWYDAGDYNKYIVNSGITMGTLLAAYEDFPAYFDTLQTNIPETGNGVPDLLNEALCNLRWMLTMQDPFDGGVYNKCTNAAFDGMVMPGVTKAPRYVVQKSTAATLDFAAVLAQSSRIFAKYNRQLPGLSDSCLQASKRAWEWAEKNPSITYDQDAMNKKFQPVITTGGYGDRSFDDERYWAAAELYVTTSDKRYEPAIRKYYRQPARL
ncbi:MAG: cellulase, partial [Sphingobacteriales bacterium]